MEYRTVSQGKNIIYSGRVLNKLVSKIGLLFTLHILTAAVLNLVGIYLELINRCILLVSYVRRFKPFSVAYSGQNMMIYLLKCKLRNTISALIR